MLVKKHPFDAQELKRWFVAKKRDLPWRRAVTPYRVWIAEVMLQQTQVSVVIDYFERWMRRFPTVQVLAEATVDEVLKMWEGLGYYSRARNLHAAARQLMAEHGGEIPSKRDALERIKGLGPYTVGALLSFAFQERAAAVDGNVVRVLARFFAIAEDTCRSPVRKRLWEIAEDILPEEEPWLVVEGLIELGATVCTKTPRCPVCPLRETCQAFQLGKQSALPLRKKQKPITHLKRHVVVVHHEGDVLLKRVVTGEVMADLYEFPYFEDPAAMASHFPFAIVFERELEEQAHTFTRYRAILFPTLWRAVEKKELADYSWIPWEKMHQLPFSSGHKRIRDTL